MSTNRLFHLLMVIALLVITACAPQVPVTPEATSAPVATLAQDKPITLHLAVADAEGRPSDPYVREFIEQVKTLSNGSISIEPFWGAGNDTEEGFEIGVIQLVRDGKADLGLSGSRAFDNESITSFQALQAPFLIDNDALSKAVATSDISTQMLDSLSSAGFVGLTLWPEDLRHPFSVIPGKVLLSPEDFANLNIRVTPSNITYLLIQTLGGKPVFGQDYEGAESGLRQGASLTGAPIATGNVTFFAKYQVLFANGPAFEKLSEYQRAILRNAAMATQEKAITEHPSEAEASNAWCADGGSIVMANAGQIAAFEAAAMPVFEKIEQDPMSAELIVMIHELKAKTQASPGAEACGAGISTENLEPTEPAIWSTGLPPNGVWQVELTIDDFINASVLRSRAKDWAGKYAYVFEDGKGTHRGSGTWGSLRCPFIAEVIEDFVRITFVDLGLGYYKCGNEKDDVQWRLDEDGLHFNFVANHGGGPVVELTVLYETRPWQKAK